MKQWNKIFKQHGKVFLRPQENLPRLVGEFKKNKIKKVLDLGCGSGRHLIYLAKRGLVVYGIDIAAEGVKQAKRWLKDENVKADLKVGSIYKKLPYQNNFFDAVISTQAIHHQKIENIREAIKEIERILKPGGYIFITVRKRKFRKFYLAGHTIEKYGKQITDYKVIAPHTYVPVAGGEKWLVHYLFTRKTIRDEFKKFKPNIWVDKEGRHYCFLGKLKK